MSNQLVWVDIPVVDLDRAIAFYAAMLGSPVTKEGGPGFLFGLLPHADNEAGGCLYTPSTPEADNAPSTIGPLVYLNANNRLTSAVQAVSAHGGKIIKDIHSMGPHGYRAIVLDSEGNRIALHSHTHAPDSSHSSHSSH